MAIFDYGQGDDYTTSARNPGKKVLMSKQKPGKKKQNDNDEVEQLDLPEQEQQLNSYLQDNSSIMLNKYSSSSHLAHSSKK